LAAAAVTDMVTEPSRACVTASPDEAIKAWIDRYAMPLPSIDAGSPVDDLDAYSLLSMRPYRRVVDVASSATMAKSCHTHSGGASNSASMVMSMPGDRCGRR
jgi:hypothetical protein